MFAALKWIKGDFKDDNNGEKVVLELTLLFLGEFLRLRLLV